MEESKPAVMTLSDEEVDTLREACLVTALTLAAWMMAVEFEQVSPGPDEIDENGHLRAHILPITYMKLLDRASREKVLTEEDLSYARHALMGIQTHIKEQEHYVKYEYMTMLGKRAASLAISIELFSAEQLANEMSDD